jgi:cyclopropane fatty-acyl-phospholipid synthase-like methyltransferase
MSLVIDLGCGTGRFSELLAAHFGVQVIGKAARVRLA